MNGQWLAGSRRVNKLPRAAEWSICAAIVFMTSGCRNTVDERTVLIEFNTTPTLEHRVSAESVGGHATFQIAAVNGIALRSDRPIGEYSSLPDYADAKQLGSEEDPLVSVFIAVESPSTEEDLAFIESVGGTRSILDQMVVGTAIRLSAVDQLTDWPRFTDFEIVQDGATIQGCINSIC